MSDDVVKYNTLVKESAHKIAEIVKESLNSIPPEFKFLIGSRIINKCFQDWYGMCFEFAQDKVAKTIKESGQHE